MISTIFSMKFINKTLLGKISLKFIFSSMMFTMIVCPYKNIWTLSSKDSWFSFLALTINAPQQLLNFISNLMISWSNFTIILMEMENSGIIITISLINGLICMMYYQIFNNIAKLMLDIFLIQVTGKKWLMKQ